MGPKSELSILSEYVNKTEKIGGTWTNKNSYGENGALSDIFSRNISRHNCSMLKYSCDWNQSVKSLLGKHELALQNLAEKNYSIEYLTTEL